MTIENIIEDEEIFKGKHATYELVAGGFVNETYKVKCGSKTYCVRVNNKEQSRFFEFDAATEAQACQQASMFSIAPGVYNIDNSSEYLITDFFAGKFLIILKLIEFSVFLTLLTNILQQMKYISRVQDVAWYLFHTGIVKEERLKKAYLEAGNNSMQKLIK